METVKVIKIGGNIIDDTQLLNEFLLKFSTIKGSKILVHGGGKLVTKLAKKLKTKTLIVDGRRITDAETLDITTMVYAGKINKTIVAKLQSNSCNALGLSGADGNTIVAIKRPVNEIDFGFVGDIVKVHIDSIELLLQNNITPVICAITHDKKGQLLNTNADTIASKISIAFSSTKKTELYYCFEKNGVLLDVNNDDSIVEYMTVKTYRELIEKNVITDGMLPKLKNCFDAINKNVYKVCIGNSEMLHNSESKYTSIKAK